MGYIENMICTTLFIPFLIRKQFKASTRRKNFYQVMTIHKEATQRYYLQRVGSDRCLVVKVMYLGLV